MTQRGEGKKEGERQREHGFHDRRVIERWLMIIDDDSIHSFHSFYGCFIRRPDLLQRVMSHKLPANDLSRRAPVSFSLPY